LIISFSFSEMFRRIENTNIGGAFGLISVSKRWMYAEIFSLMIRRISLARNRGSFSEIFSMSKSWASCSNSGSVWSCFSSS